MLFLHLTQLLMDVNFIHHTTGVIASIDMSGVQHAITKIAHPLLQRACTPAQQPADGTELRDVTNFVGDIEVTVKVVSGGAFVIGISSGAIMRMLAFGSDRRVAMSNVALSGSVVGFVIFIADTGIQSYLQGVFGCG